MFPMASMDLKTLIHYHFALPSITFRLEPFFRITMWAKKYQLFYYGDLLTMEPLKYSFFMAVIKKLLTTGDNVIKLFTAISYNFS